MQLAESCGGELSRREKLRDVHSKPATVLRLLALCAKPASYPQHGRRLNVAGSVLRNVQELVALDTNGKGGR